MPHSIAAWSARFRNGVSSMDRSAGCASRICSSSVVPERGNATMKIGLSSTPGAPASCQVAISSGSQPLRARSIAGEASVACLTAAVSRKATCERCASSSVA